MTEFDSVIPAGGSGKLKARIKTTATQGGVTSKGISVITDAKGAEKFTLSMSFRAVPAVTVLPRPRIFLSGIQGDTVSNTLVVRRHDGEPLEIQDIVVNNDQLKVTATKVTKAGQVDRQKVAPGDVVVVVAPVAGTGPVTANGRLKLKTNHPDAPEIDVPYTLRLRAIIEARPAQVRLLIEEGNKAGRMTLLRVVNHRRDSFKLTGFTASAPEIFSAHLTDGDVAAQVHTVAVMLTDDVVPGAIDQRRIETLVVQTDDSAHPEIAIPVMIEPRLPRQARAPRPLP